MTAATDQLCQVCDRRTQTRCSGCRSVYFCSRECQSAVWSTHKWLCTKPLDAFTFPPLTTAEAACLRELVASKDKIVRALLDKISGGSLYSADAACDDDLWKEGNYENVINQVTLADCPIREPRRSLVLYELHQFLRAVRSRDLAPVPGPTPWTDTAYAYWVAWDSMLLGSALQPLFRGGVNPLVATNSSFRQLLVYFTLAHRKRAGKALPLLADGSDILALAVERIKTSPPGEHARIGPVLATKAAAETRADDTGKREVYVSPMDAIGSKDFLSLGPPEALAQALTGSFEAMGLDVSRFASEWFR